MAPEWALREHPPSGQRDPAPRTKEMFRPSPAIAAWGLRARNLQRDVEQLVLETTEAAQRRQVMELEARMPQLSESSLLSLALPLSELTWLALTLLILPCLTLPCLTLPLLPVPLLPCFRVPLPTGQAGPLPAAHWNSAIDIQSARESDPDTRPSPWSSHARPNLQRPLRSPEPSTGNTPAGSGQAGDHPEGQTHPTPEGGPPALAACLSKPFRRLLSTP